jgi:ribosomal 50S subunit-associated protein YjgA (DUF615 family)
MQEYREKESNITVSLPSEFDVKSAADMVAEIATLKESNVPYIALIESTKRFLLKQFGNNEKNQKIFDFLAKVDRLFAYGTNDMVQAKALFGSDITQRELAIHQFGYQVLEEIVEANPEADNQQLRALFDASISEYVREVTITQPIL